MPMLLECAPPWQVTKPHFITHYFFTERLFLLKDTSLNFDLIHVYQRGVCGCVLCCTGRLLATLASHATLLQNTAF